VHPKIYVTAKINTAIGFMFITLYRFLMSNYCQVEMTAKDCQAHGLNREQKLPTCIKANTKPKYQLSKFTSHSYAMLLAPPGEHD